MILGVTGYGATGASACVDLIKEFDNVQSFYSSFEFQLLQQPDGLCDLKYYLIQSGRRLDNIGALSRFEKNIKNSRSYNINHASSGKYFQLTTDYLNKLKTISWKGRSAYDAYDLRPFYDKISLYKFGRIINKVLHMINTDFGWPLSHSQSYSCVTETEFDRYTNDYLNEIFVAAGFDLKAPILIEQAFNTTNPTEGMEFFDDVKAIIVDRDPRDVYILSNVTAKSVCGFMPNTGDVKAYVDYYKSLHHEHTKDQRVMYLQYEDLIYKYDSMCDVLSKFTGLKHVYKGEKFKPQHSINNVQQYKNFPELKKEIAYIENELQEYLYPFDENIQFLSFEPVKMKSFDRQVEADRQVRKLRHS